MILNKTKIPQYIEIYVKLRTNLNSIIFKCTNRQQTYKERLEMITINQVSYKLPLEQWERDMTHRIFSRSFCTAGDTLFLNLGHNYTRF